MRGSAIMYKNKSKDGTNNICGKKVRLYRKALDGNISQNGFSNLLQIEGIDVDKNAIQRIESGERFVTDIELKALAKVLNVKYTDLLDD